MQPTNNQNSPDQTFMFPVLETGETLPYTYQTHKSMSIFFDDTNFYNLYVSYTNDNDKSISFKFIFHRDAIYETLNPEIINKSLSILNSDEFKTESQDRNSFLNDAIKKAKKDDNQFEKCKLLICLGEKVNNIFRFEGGTNITTPLKFALSRDLNDRYIELLACNGGKVYSITPEEQKKIDSIMQPHILKVKLLSKLFCNETSSSFNCFPKELREFLGKTTLQVLEIKSETASKLLACKTYAQIAKENTFVFKCTNFISSFFNT